MAYINRRLAITINGESRELSDRDFFLLNGPLVVLGEPGAGKSEIVRQLTLGTGTIFYSASSVLSFPALPFHDCKARVVIDGFDEVTAYSGGAPVSQVLSKIQNDDISKFVFTCRVADWQHEVNANIIANRWKEYPIVGKLLPLSNDEIVAFVEENGDVIKGDVFIDDASKHDCIDLLRNPQTLIMLLGIVKTAGWPKTRIQLYEEACKVLCSEDNPTHRWRFRVM
jgi:hypothetical protein